MHKADVNVIDFELEEFRKYFLTSFNYASIIIIS